MKGATKPSEVLQKWKLETAPMFCHMICAERIAKNQLKILPGSLHSLCHLDTLGMPLGFLHDTVLACSCAAALCISKWTLCCSKLWPSTSRIPTNAGNHRLTNSSTRGWPEKEECPKTEGRPRRIVSPLPKLTMNG